MRSNNEKIKFYEAINFALHTAMTRDRKMICYGLGINDPKNIFGTTKNLRNKFGKSRVFDVPTSENALTGISIGASINGIRSVVTHQRLDFFLLAMDQLVNSAAKWHYMFGSKMNVPITIRLIIGRGWGQGPTHSQSLHSWFAHIPGLKVIAPSNAYDAAGLLYASIFDPNPVIFIEHRWLHNISGLKNRLIKTESLEKSKIVKKGKDITIVSISYLTIVALEAAKFLKKYNINCEVIDLISIRPIDWKTIYKSIRKTGRVLVLDMGAKTGSVASEIIANISINSFSNLKNAPCVIAMPDVPVPTSFGLTKNFYPSTNTIIEKIFSIFRKRVKYNKNLFRSLPHDVPGKFFKGPF